MFNGWMQLAGNEVINVARTMAYVEAGYVPSGLQVDACDECEHLPELLGDKPYATPLIDQAPWFESGNADSWDFAGIIPLEVTGLNGSTRTATVSEMVGDGGSVSASRYGSRTIAYTALLVGKTTCGVEAGLAWLSQVLGGSNCTGRRPTGTSACDGDEMCVLSCCPGELSEQIIPDQVDTTQIPLYGWTAAGGFFDGTTGEFEPTVRPPGTWTNLVPNPSFEVDTARWRTGTTPGAITATNRAINPIGTAPPTTWWLPTRVAVTAGTDYLRGTITDAAVGPLAQRFVTATSNTSPDRIQVSPGDVVRFSIEARSSQSFPMQLTIQAQDAAGNVIGGNLTGPATATNPTTFTALPVLERTVPANTAYVSVQVGIAGSGPRAIGDTFDIRKARVIVNTPLVPWFDGNTPATDTATYAWTGAAKASTSTERALVPVGSLVRSTDLWPSRWGSASALWTADAAGGQYIETDPLTLPAGAWLNTRLSVGTSTTQLSARASIRFYNASGALIGSATEGAWLDLNTLSYGVRVLSAARPAGAVTARLRVEFQTIGGGLLPTGTLAYVDAVIAEVFSSARTPTYVDGDMSDTDSATFTWNGTPHNSTTTATIAALPVVLTGPVIECIDQAVFDFGFETVKGNVRVQPQAIDPDGAVLWTGDWVTVLGGSPDVTINAFTDWGDWRPRLNVDPATPNPFSIDPMLAHSKYQSIEECADALTKSYLDVTTISGPTVVEEIATSCGEKLLRVEWTMAAGNPMILGPEERLITGMYSETAGPQAPLEQRWSKAYGVQTGIVEDTILDSETACDLAVAPALIGVFDPCCTGFLAPPAVPAIEDSCFMRPTSYYRSWVTIPKNYAPEVEDGLLSITITNDSHTKRGLRVRVYPDPVEHGYAGISECDFCDEFFITYIPAGATWRLDGPNTLVTTQPAGTSAKIVSSASVRGRAGGPFQFPVTQCNTGYVVVVDTPTVYMENCGADCLGFPQGDLWVDVTMRRASM